MKDFLSYRSGGTRVLSFALLLLSGCAAVGPDYVRPAENAPEAWQAELQGGLTPELPNAAALAHWWTILQDAPLAALIEQASSGSLDLQAAQARIREARALRAASEAGIFPTLDGSAAASKSRSSASSGSGNGNERELYTAGFDASWELDIFGGVRRSLEVTQASLEATEADQRQLQVSLLAEVALNYVALRTYQARLALSQQTIAAQQQSYALNDSRYRAGLIGELPVQESLRQLESSRALIPALESGLDASKNRLAVLLGERPGRLHQQLAAHQPLPVLPERVAIGIPAETLRRRPDVRSAERRLAAQTARVGVATADLYPKFHLFGSLGLEALSAGDLLQSASRTWGFGPGVKWKLFSGGAIRSNIEVQNARQEQALIDYERTVLRALEEVENALVAYAKEQLRHASLAKAAQAAARALQLADDQYQAGLVSFNNVLDAQRAQLALQDELTRSDGSLIANFIRLYKAFGGGWNAPSAE